MLVLYILFSGRVTSSFLKFRKSKFKYFQVIAAFLARRYRNQLDPQEKAARAIFPQRDYLY